jgi:Mrp family chromosome partitioning ATPase
VLVDLPPVADSVDAAAIARHADAVVVVVAAGRSTIDDVKQALRALRGVGANIVGAVLVDVPARKPFWGMG